MLLIPMFLTFKIKIIFLLWSLIIPILQSTSFPPSDFLQHTPSTLHLSFRNIYSILLERKWWCLVKQPSNYPVTNASFDFIEFRFQQLSFLLTIYLKSCLSGSFVETLWVVAYRVFHRSPFEMNKYVVNVNSDLFNIQS